MPFAAGLSEHPLATHAVGEVVGEVLERLGPEPDLAVVLVTAPHAGALEDIAGVVRATLAPRVLLGATAVSVLGGRREVEDAAAVALWAGRLGTVAPVRLTARTTGGGLRIDGLDPERLDRASTLLLLADPFSLPVERLLADVHDRHPGLTVVGGLASAARGPGGNRLVLGEATHADGAVGVLLHRPVATVVSQGCRPIGHPLTVTRSERNVVYELAGRPALARLQEVLGGLDADERALAARGLHVGRVIDEHRAEFGRGDFLIRGVLGADREVGALAVGEVVEVGATLQFQVRDAASADEDLRALLAGTSADAALVFTCNGRGTGLFGRPDHDASLVSDLLGGVPVAGMFCAGEIGPVGGRPFVHGLTASVALFRDDPGPPG
ncbi:MAG: FIST C-terminal domain-containing protein [Acidimicrobiales bacterium]|nr:FIST C-terminal domain-containing protein [Acidimicrobiales bacterium]